MRGARRHLVLYGALAVAAAAAIIFGLNDVYGFLNSSSTNTGTQRTATVGRGTVQASVSASGNVGVADSASADFPTSGTLIAIDVAVGAHVKAGQVLAKIDPTSAENALMSAKANLEQAESALSTARSGLTAAQQAANTSSLEQAEQTVTTDEQQLASDQTTLATAKAQLASDKDLNCPASSSGSSSLASNTTGANSSTSGGGNAASGGNSSNSTGATGNSTSDNGTGFTGTGGTSSTGTGTGTGGTGTGGTGTGGTGTGGTTGGTGAGGTGGETAGANRTTASAVNGVDLTTSQAATTPTSTTPTGTGGTAGGGTATGGTATTGTGASGSSGQGAGSLGSSSTASSTSPVVTGQASSVGVTSAMLSGSVDPGGLDTTYWFEYGTSATSLDATTGKLDAGSGSQAVPVSVQVSGLSAGKTYLFRLVASNSSTTSNGDLASFTTSAPDFASTGQASSVGPTSATLGGSVSPSGMATTYYFELGLSASALTRHSSHYAAGSGSAVVPVSVAVSGLKPNENYLFRLVAVNAAGTSDGALELFRTSGVAQSAATGAVSSVGATTATLSGTVSPSGLATRYWFAYGTSPTQLTRRTAKLDAGAGTAALPVTATVDGLKPDTPYYFELVADNASGTSTGTEETFTTDASAVPAVTTGSASAELTSVVTLTGTVNPGGSDTKYWFEYGTTGAYGRRTPVEDAGSGTSPTEVTATVSGLKSNTEYLFRLVAHNAFGSSSGIGEVAKTAESACVSDAQTVSEDEQTLQRQEGTVTSAKENLVQTQATINADETPSAATIASDEATVAQDEATVAADEKTLAETTLTAPIAGVVTAVDGSIGQTVGGSGSAVTTAAASAVSASSSSGGGTFGGSASTSNNSSSSSGFITIDSLGQLEIVAGFPEADATKIAVGQPATITFPALPETEVAGKVVAVSNTSTVVSNVVTYDETIALINPPAEVKEGMTADVSVVDQSASGVLELPSSAITTTGTRSTVELLVDGKETLTPVVTGLVGNSSTQIVSGLKLGDTVVEPTVTVSAATGSTTAGTGFSGLGGGGGFTGLGGGGFGGGGGFARGG